MTEPTKHQAVHLTVPSEAKVRAGARGIRHAVQCTGEIAHRAALACLTAASAIDRPEGPGESSGRTEKWVTVPRELTREQWAKAGDAVVELQSQGVGHHDKIVEAVFEALVAASPHVPKGEALPVVSEEMVATLKPFAEVSAKAKGSDDACWCGQDGAVIRYRDLRRAAALYETLALLSRGEE